MENKFILILLIITRFVMGFGLGMLPILIGLKDTEWYTYTLVILNIIIQFGLATYQTYPYIMKLFK